MAQEKQRAAERIKQLETLRSSEISEMELYIKDLEAEITVLKLENRTKSQALKSKAATITGMREQFLQIKERLIIDHDQV